MNINQLLAVTDGASSIWQLVLYVCGIVLASSIVIEISPIKINPLKKIIQLVSKNFKEWFTNIIDDSLDKQLSEIKEDDKKRDGAIISLTEKIDGITERVDQMQKHMDENEYRAQSNHISDIRRSILGFSDNLRAGMESSKESFDDILEQYDEYEQFVEEHSIPNNRMDLSVQFIREQYQQRFNKISH